MNSNYKYKNPWLGKVFQKLIGIDDAVEKLRPDIIVTREIFSPLSYQITKLNDSERFKHIIYVDETTEINNSAWGLFPLTRKYAKYNACKNNYYISSSNKAMNSLLKIGIDKEKIILVRISIYTNKYLESQTSDGGKFRILFLGNLERNKGILTILKAIRQLRIKDLEFHFAGKGSLKDIIIEESMKNNHIIYHGYVSETLKIDLLQKSNLFVYPSEDIMLPFGIKRWEEQGAISALEAMASGLPVIGSDSGALPEIIEGNPIIKQGDSNSLAENIEILLSDEKMRKYLHQYNMKRVRELYDIDKNKIKLKIYLTDVVV
ncbi:MAG: glycosyltransferase family 4 protein [Caldisphaera sp.]